MVSKAPLTSASSVKVLDSSSLLRLIRAPDCTAVSNDCMSDPPRGFLDKSSPVRLIQDVCMNDDMMSVKLLLHKESSCKAVIEAEALLNRSAISLSDNLNLVCTRYSHCTCSLPFALESMSVSSFNSLSSNAQ